MRDRAAVLHGAADLVEVSGERGREHAGGVLRECPALHERGHELAQHALGGVLGLVGDARRRQLDPDAPALRRRPPMRPFPAPYSSQNYAPIKYTLCSIERSLEHAQRIVYDVSTVPDLRR